MSWFHHFRLLCWKNWIMIKIHWIAAFFELTFPIIIVLLFGFVNFAIYKNRGTTHPAQHFRSFSPYRESCYMFPDSRGSAFSDDTAIKSIGFTMNDSVTDKIMKHYFQETFTLKGFESVEKLEAWIESKNYRAVAVIFDESFKSSGYKHLKYTIRLPTSFITPWHADKLYHNTKVRKSRIDENGFAASPPYFLECFLAIQSSIDNAFIDDATAPIIKMNAFPYPKYDEIEFGEVVSSLFPFFFTVCMIFSLKNIIKNCGVERESGLKESMKMVGLSSGVYWSSWFMRCLIMLIIPFSINCVLMSTSVMPTYKYSNPFLIWIFFVLYITTVITYGFMMSVLFKRTSVAVTTGWLSFIFTILLYNGMDENFGSFHYVVKILLCLLVNGNMAIGVDLILFFEKYQEGVRFSNLFERDVVMNFSFGELLVFMLAGSIFQMLFTLYIERVSPGKFGIAEPWYFPAKWILKICLKERNSKTPYNKKVSSAEFEAEPRNLKVGIKIEKLGKKFGSKFAVRDFSLNIYEGQITALLGHNGAGKTTILNILIGLFSPSFGTAFINGKDIRTQLVEARNSLGICPQQNMLFDDLTVEEHLIFFCKLKGMKNRNAIWKEISRLAASLNFKHMLKKSIKTLSGGMKRKLSIAIALCGNSKVLILDEPTAGLDPGARRELWNVLINEKKGRTILLTTHFMDEAEVLGDRIAIINEGNLMTAGSPYFLKQRYGSGYRVTFVKQRTFNSGSVMGIIRRFIPYSFLESESETEAVFIIDERQLPIYDQLFKTLEEGAEVLGIESFGCSLSSLEDVFLRLGSEAQTVTRQSNKFSNMRHPNIIINKKPLKMTGSNLLLYKIQAILIKKYHVLRASWKSFLSMIIFTILLLFIFSVKFNFFGEPPKLKISLENYGQSYTIMEGTNSGFSKSYEKLFEGKNYFEKTDNNMTEYAGKISNKTFGKFFKKHLIGGTFKPNSVTAWFNGQLFHTMPLSINQISRAVLKSIKGENYDITVFNQPFKPTLKDSESFAEMFEEAVSYVNTGLMLFALFILLTYWPFVLTTHYVAERETEGKLMQFVSGMNQYVYWLTSFVFDWIIFFIICCFLIAYATLTGKYLIKSWGGYKVLLVISISYGFSMLPFSYLCSFMFRKTSTFIAIYSVLSLALAILAGVFAVLGHSIHTETIQIIGCFFPPYSLVTQLSTSAIFIIVKDFSLIYSFETGIGKYLIINLISGIIYILLCLLIDLNFFNNFRYKFQFKVYSKLPRLSDNTDDDIKKEILKVKAVLRHDYSNNFVVRRLSKFYKQHLAVNQIYLDAPTHECFGMLGVNGAGKTTAFKMMIGEVLISYGDVYMKGLSIKTNKKDIYKLIGYCPQFDGLLPELTAAQTLKIFALIHGIDKNEIDQIINDTAKNFGLTKHLNKKISTFSGGNKRKLSASLALLGDPKIIFLDEPTTGIDPQARRMVWSALKKVQKTGSTVILSSHAMDECEALCSRVGIMSRGEFKCIGSVQHLKNKFAKGYVVTIKIGRNDPQKYLAVQEKIYKIFGPSAKLKEKYLDILTFNVTQTFLKWSDMFNIMATMKEEMNFDSYAVTQMTLEQVFLLFTTGNK